MYRRDFFKSLLFTPLLTPLLLASKKSAGDTDLYLISDSPHLDLPPLLEEIESFGLVTGKTFSVDRTAGAGNLLQSTLETSGWTPVPAGVNAHMRLSTSLLNRPARPSFTLAREGAVWDVRTKNLRTLWNSMSSKGPSSLLTSLSFQARPAAQVSGKSVTVYKNGTKMRTVPLGKNAAYAVPLERGAFSMSIQNGKVSVEKSPCRHKICVHCPPAGYSGERIICAPSQVILEIDGPSAVDAIIG